MEVPIDDDLLAARFPLPEHSDVERGGGIALATSGSGDVLAGLVAGLAARGAHPLTATLWGVHVHAAAGDRLPIGTLARELIDEAAAPLRRR